MTLATPHVIFFLMGLSLAASALIDLRRPSVKRNCPFRAVMLAMAFAIARIRAPGTLRFQSS